MEYSTNLGDLSTMTTGTSTLEDTVSTQGSTVLETDSPQVLPPTLPSRVLSDFSTVLADGAGDFSTQTYVHPEAIHNDMDLIMIMVIASVLLALVLLGTIVLRYVLRHRGTYYTHEAKGSNGTNTELQETLLEEEGLPSGMA